MWNPRRVKEPITTIDSTSQPRDTTTATDQSSPPVISFVPHSVFRKARPGKTSSIISDTTSHISGFTTDDEAWSVQGADESMIVQTTEKLLGEKVARQHQGGDDKLEDGGKTGSIKEEGVATSLNDSFEGVSSVDTQSVFTDMEEALSYKQEKSSKDLQVYREDTKDANMVQADDANMDEPTSTTKRQLISGRVTPEGHSPKKIKTSPSHTEIRHQALLLQNQLSAFTRTLEGTGPSPLPLGFDLVDKPATTMNATNDLMTVTESKYLASADKKIKKLNKKNAVLQQQLDVLWTKVRVMQEDADLRGQSGEYDRVTMGIDPQVVQLLAVDLVTGDRSRGVIAEEMFSLVERAIPLVSDPDELKRTKMAPRERLRSLEGVVDISLGRVELLEQKIKAIEDPSWFKPSGPIVGYTSDDDDEDTEDGRSKAEKVKDEAWADEVVASTSSSTNAAR